jgi:hypothetical protein
MKKTAALVLSFFFLTGTVLADSPKSSDAQPAKSATPSKAAAAKAASADPAAIAAALEQLRQTLEAQQEEIQQLKEALSKRDQQIGEARDAAVSAGARASEASSKADEAISAASAVKGVVDSAEATKAQEADISARVAKVEKAVDTGNKEIKALSNIKLSGDLRLRYEPFFGGGPASGAALPDRHRERYRLRLNVNTKITDDFAVGFSLASGDTGDPISTNSTETGFYTRKSFAVDKAFGTYNPHSFKPFSLTVGKFAYTWHRTELTWDNDLNPEGASEQLAWDWKDKFLTHFAVVGFETPIFEVGAGPDTYMTGGQVQTAWKILPRTKLSVDAAYYDFNKPDAIAQNQNGGNGFTTSGTPTGLGGNFGFGGSTNTNNFGTINGKRVYVSKWGILDTMLRLDFDTGSKRWPIYTLFNYAANTRACENRQAFISAGLTAPACDPHQRHAYWAEVQFGQTKNKGDMRFGYTFMRVERDAVLAAFNFSDMRQPTNVAQHRIEAMFQAYPHVQLGFTGLIGRQLVTAQSPTPERWLKRYQFDTIFTF